MITGYTRESGVRQLERQLGSILRKLARQAAQGVQIPSVIEAELVHDLLGHASVRPERAATEDEVGSATGMYYTPAGGDIMFVEAVVRQRRPGKAVSDALGDVSLILTGQLGEVMRESARAALTYATSHQRELSIPTERLGSLEVHVHVPAGAIPKDGPSAGVTMAVALASALSGRKVLKQPESELQRAEQASKGADCDADPVAGAGAKIAAGAPAKAGTNDPSATESKTLGTSAYRRRKHWRVRMTPPASTNQKTNIAAGAPSTHKVKTRNEGFVQHGKRDARDTDATISTTCAGFDAPFSDHKPRHN